MSLAIIKSANFNVDDVEFSKPRKNKRGGKMTFISSNNARFLLQLPEMRAPFGLSKFEDDSGNVSYNLDLSMDGYNEDGPVGDLYTKLRAMDEAIIDHVQKNSKELLGKEYSKEVLEALYKPMVRQPSKPEYAPTLKMKVGYRDDAFQAQAYLPNREECELSLIEKGTRAKTIAEIAMIWFIDNKFGPSVRLQQAMISPHARLKACAFSDSDDDDEKSEGDDFEDYA